MITYDNQKCAFYRTDRVQEILGGASKQDIDDLVREHRLLRIATFDGDHVYSALQFDKNGLNPAISDLVKIMLDRGIDGWTILYWLVAPIEEMGNKDAIQVVLDNGDIDRLREIAREDAHCLND